MARTWLWASVSLTAVALAAVVALAPPAGAAPIQALSWLLFTGSSVHVAATGWLFTVPAVREYAREHTARCLWVPAGLIIVAAIAAASMTPAAFQWLLAPYFGWQFFHYCKQNIGMVSLAAAADRVRSPGPAERWPLLASGVCAVVALAARPGLLGLRIGPVAHALFAPATAIFVVAVSAGLVAIARRPAADRTVGFCATYLISLAFSLPIFVLASPYAAVGGMTVAHGLQYLLLVGLIAGGDGPADPQPSRLVRLGLLANIALIGGVVLSAASHSHSAGHAGRLIFGAYLGVVMAHFVIDAGLWRMRDPLARKFLATSLPYLMTRAVPMAQAAGTSTDPS